MDVSDGVNIDKIGYMLGMLKFGLKLLKSNLSFLSFFI